MAQKTATLPICSLAYKLDEKVDLESKFRECRFFCFLPMPETIELSGLPFHIHGSFGLRDDRRDFKWLSSDNRRDESAQWNEFLLDEVLDTTLVKILNYAQNAITTMNADFNSLIEYYFLIPVWENASGNWRERHLAAFFRRLGEVDLIMNRYGEWVKMRNVLFTNRIDDAMHKFAAQNGETEEIIREAVLKCFDSKLLPKIPVPRHVIHAFEKFHGTNVLTFIDVNSLCQSLRGKDMNFSDAEKSCLLNFLIQSVDSLSQLDGMFLLPLCNSSWSKFEQTGNRIYLFVPDRDDQFEKVFERRIQSVMFDKSKLNRASTNKLIDLLRQQAVNSRIVEFNAQKYLYNIRLN